jgi:hypothetical protein
MVVWRNALAGPAAGLIRIGRVGLSPVRQAIDPEVPIAIIARDVTRNRLLDEILSFFGDKAAPMMAQLADAGKLTPDDVQEVERTLRRLKVRRKEEPK